VLPQNSEGVSGCEDGAGLRGVVIWGRFRVISIAYPHPFYCNKWMRICYTNPISTIISKERGVQNEEKVEKTNGCLVCSSDAYDDAGCGRIG
jgi:hypothetical protein